MGKIFIGDTSLSEKFSWMEANHENNEIKSTTKIFTYMVYPNGHGVVGIVGLVFTTIIYVVCYV